MIDTVDSVADAAYIRLTDGPVSVTREMGEDRLVDLDALGAVVGVEFLNVSSGVHVGGLPVQGTLLAYRLRQLGVLIQDEPIVAVNVQVSAYTLGHQFSIGHQLSMHNIAPQVIQVPNEWLPSPSGSGQAPEIPSPSPTFEGTASQPGFLTAAA
jgi:uncharacterized protein YuzE